MTTPPRSVGARPSGYTMGQASVPRAPITLEELGRIKTVLTWTEDDAEALRQMGTILAPRVEELVDTWYAFVAQTPSLIETFSDPTKGAPDKEYLAKVRGRFVQWVRDTLEVRHDQAWLDYQFEIGARHHRTKKNRTDHAHGSDIVPFRYMFPLVVPLTTTVRPFLESEASHEEVDRMLLAWTKVLLLQATLWSHPYVHDADW